MPSDQSWRLDAQAGDRATAYSMSCKILTLPQGHLCTWIDVNKHNRWALVDPRSKDTLAAGSIGSPGIDNHCGAALAQTADGQVHAVLGGHHSPLDHYRLDQKASPTAWSWRLVDRINCRATYPCLHATGNCLHLSFRLLTAAWCLGYCNFQDEAWSPVDVVLQSKTAGYRYWTNGMCHDGNTLFLCAGTMPVDEQGGRRFSAALLSRDDDTGAWRTDTGLPLSVEHSHAEDVPDFVPLAFQAQTTAAQWHTHAAAGPDNHNYLQLMLSNPVCHKDQVHVLVHNGVRGGLALASQYKGTWQVEDLSDTVFKEGACNRVHMQSTLQACSDGSLQAIIMTNSHTHWSWGVSGTQLTLLRWNTAGKLQEVVPLAKPAAGSACWLPGLPHAAADTVSPMPFIYTHGQNAGGFSNNNNAMTTQVMLGELPPMANQ